ncbi:putative mitochondrial protein AtMg00860 [Silene latifolia]|uniref:putative mitochondrial protein AtMg00860 n=1 Tax=Silene latifolia TaxID=37657 RepID=UPI003D77AB02
MRDHKLFVKPSKCYFGAVQLEYLGHVISRQGVATDPSKIAAVAEWPQPKTLKQLRRSLGLTGYYRRFIQNYRAISKPLTLLLRKNFSHWSEDAGKAFEKLKSAMVSAPVLALPNFSKTFVVELTLMEKEYELF